MAWTAPRTWVAGEMLTAALLNTHLRDNLLQTAVAIVSAAGDIVYATASNALARLAIGQTDDLLTVAAGLPAWTSIGKLLMAKQATSPTVASSMTLIDTSLTFSVKSGKTYVFWAGVRITGGTSIGARVGVNGPTLTDGGFIANGQQNNVPQDAAVTAYGTVLSVSSGSGASAINNVYGYLTVSADGTVSIQFANGAAGGTTTFAKGGILLAAKIA